MIKSTVVQVLGAKPVWSLLLKRALKDRPLTIMCYHTLSADTGGINSWTSLRRKDFKAQLADLQDIYDIVSLDDALAAPPGRTGRPCIVITFDDGDRGLYTHLLPIVQETGVPVTLYIATEQFETGRPFWFDRVVNALQGPGEVGLDGIGRWSLPGSGDKAHWAALGQVLNALKSVPPSEREAAADALVAQGQPPVDNAETLGPMTLEQLQILGKTPGITIGAHTHGHELLDQIPADAARDSVARSRDLLRDWTGQNVRHFAFPNGNHTQSLRDMIRGLGFASATILEDRTAPQGTDPFALPRISVGRYDSRARVRLRLAGI